MCLIRLYERLEFTEKDVWDRKTLVPLERLWCGKTEGRAEIQGQRIGVKGRWEGEETGVCKCKEKALAIKGVLGVA
jgi:hypothetical protein